MLEDDEELVNPKRDNRIKALIHRYELENGVFLQKLALEHLVAFLEMVDREFHPLFRDMADELGLTEQINLANIKKEG